jgi:hypothetical protein
VQNCPGGDPYRQDRELAGIGLEGRVHGSPAARCREPGSGTQPCGISVITAVVRGDRPLDRSPVLGRPSRTLTSTPFPIGKQSKASGTAPEDDLAGGRQRRSGPGPGSVGKRRAVAPGGPAEPQRLSATWRRSAASGGVVAGGGCLCRGRRLFGGRGRVSCRLFGGWSGPSLSQSPKSSPMRSWKVSTDRTPNSRNDQMRAARRTPRTRIGAGRMRRLIRASRPE